MKLLLLHLSDIHIKDNTNPILDRYKEITATLFSVIPEASALFVVITGDIAYSGTKTEYIYASQFINNLINHIKETSEIPIHVLMVPGNHDGDFKNGGKIRTTVIEKVRSTGESYIDDEVIAQCTEPQRDYFEFERQFATDNLTYDDPLWKEYRFKLNDKTIAFSAINASWMSQVPEKQGQLIFPVKRYSDLHNQHASVRVLLLHHPLNWYAQDTYHPLRDLCRSYFQIVMTGHEHVASASITIDSSRSQTVNLEAGALVADNGTTSNFSVITIDLEKNRFAKEAFSWAGSMYLPANGVAIWDTYLPLPENQPNNFQISDQMRERIESLGAAFSHPNIDSLKLSDVFIYPDLMEINSDDDQSENVNSDILSKQLESLDKVLIFGDDQYGKSSLLFHLFHQHHNAGFVPVLLNAQDFKNATEDQFGRIIHRTVITQYGEDSINKYDQKDNRKKIALVDNIEKLGVRGDVLARVVNYLNKHFKYIVLTAGDRFDVTILSSTDASQALKPFKSFRMLGFGYKLRNELIRRWYQVGADLKFDELQEKVHNAEQVINSILGKGLVPMTAFNVLVLLQTIEINQKGTLANAGLAQYYEFLIRRSLFDAKVKSDELDEVLNYLAHLAWHMHELKTKSIKEDELTRFNLNFSAEVYKTSLIDRVKTLESAKILVRKDDDFYFAYSYLNYFFVAMYMAANLEESPELKEKVVHICRHLYIKENANVILFLTHHTSSKWIIREVASVLSELLSDTKPLNLETDTVLINTWVSEKARVAIDTTDHIENQKHVRKIDDKTSTYKEPEQTKELASIKDLDQISQLNLLFKTSEILGQILKSRYGSLNKEVKAELLKDLFDAPLRAVNFFLDLVNKLPDALLTEISDRIQSKVPTTDKEKCDRAAKKFIFSIIGAVADSFLSRQGDIIGSPKLIDSIEDIANKKGDLTYKLVSISAQLSYPNHAPIVQIKKLANDLESNYFGYKVLQGLAARHMYMYSLPQQERHALASAVSIDIHSQRGIEMKSEGIKKLKNTQSKINHPKNILAKLHDSFLTNNKTVKQTLARYDKKGSVDPTDE